MFLLANTPKLSLSLPPMELAATTSSADASLSLPFNFLTARTLLVNSPDTTHGYATRVTLLLLLVRYIKTALWPCNLKSCLSPDNFCLMLASKGEKNIIAGYRLDANCKIPTASYQALMHISACAMVSYAHSSDGPTRALRVISRWPSSWLFLRNSDATVT